MASQWKPVTSFLIYINDIGSDISTDSLLHLFADDAKLCRAITTHIDCSILQVDIRVRSVNTWCETWDMNFNPIKCKHLRTTKKRNPVCATYHLGTDVLTLSKEETDLGIIMSHNFMLNVNIANRMLGIIKRTCGRRPISDVRYTYTSRNPTWSMLVKSGLPIKLTWSISWKESRGGRPKSL